VRPFGKVGLSYETTNIASSLCALFPPVEASSVQTVYGYICLRKTKNHRPKVINEQSFRPPIFLLPAPLSCVATMKRRLLQFLDADVAVPDPFGFVLKADVALGGPVLDCRCADVQINNLLPVEDDLQLLVLERDDISIPLTGRFYHVLGGCSGANHTTTIVVSHVLFSVGVENLDLEAAFHMVFEISHVHEDARISLGIELELEIEDEIAVLTIGRQVILVPRPAGFTRSWFECNDIVLLHDPVAGCIPAV
jgi:hypothetical protein